MTLLPLRARPLNDGRTLFTDQAGRFFVGSSEFLLRLLNEDLLPTDHDFLERESYSYSSKEDLNYAAHCHDVAQRCAGAFELNYLILVPTLRCNLSCSYCQVSRAAIDASGHDWSDDTLEAVLSVIDSLSAEAVKIEFQGGEPTLRPDLIKAVIERCGQRTRAEYVICTNLSNVTDEILAIFDRDDVYVSTSLDGDHQTHLANRTKSEELTSDFERNLQFVLDRYGPGKVSALPTINATSPPDADTLIDSFVSRGLSSIYLRPINYHGFARKKHSDARNQGASWRSYYEDFIRKLIQRNWDDPDRCIEETYFTLCLNRVFRTGMDQHVDLRNPNPVGVDYVVIDYDGQVYPTDEARMLSRSRVIDLAIGTVREGWDSPKRHQLNTHSTNSFDPDCSRCAYQPYCGRDIVDDLARYGRIDLPRTDTAFCTRHLHLFDFIFELIYSGDEPTLYSLSRWLRLPRSVLEMGTQHS